MQKTIPRKFQSETVTNVNEYLIYQHKDMGRTILVHGVELDNCWVIPHNVYLLTKYDAHINIEVYNNIRGVKYLFKYVYKGHDRATIEISCQSENTICPINKWCCSMMMMMCRKWQHDQPFPERC